MGGLGFKTNLEGTVTSQKIHGTLVTARIMLEKTMAVFLKQSVNLGVELYQVKSKSQKSSTQKSVAIVFIFGWLLENKDCKWSIDKIK